VLEVEVTADADAVASTLGRHGVECTVDGRRVHVRIDGIPPYDLIRDTVADLDIGLVRMGQRRHTLEDLFNVQPAPDLEAVEAASG
jgi:ABC-2 type transport system ATP-binding protein